MQPFAALYDRMIQAHKASMSVSSIEEAPFPTGVNYADPESYNPPGLSTTDMARAKKTLLKCGLPGVLWDFEEQICTTYSIDPSHGLEHACRVLMWCSHILSADESFRGLGVGVRDLQDVVFAAGFLHDALDDKYIPPADISRLHGELRNILVSAYTDGIIVDAVIGAIECMSFSARYARLAAGLSPIPDMMNTGKRIAPMTMLCRIATHIISDADMLDAYNPMRCRDFRVHKSPAVYAGWETTPTIRRKLYAGVGGIIRNRVLHYRDVYIFTPIAKKYALELHNNALRWAIAMTGDIPDDELTYHPGTASAAAHRMTSETSTSTSIVSIGSSNVSSSAHETTHQDVPVMVQ